MSISKDSRIAIIGAGPAGLAAGMYLEQAGFHDYTILERTDHVGGKCHSPNYHGRRYEMGAIMGVPSYDAIQEIMDRTGDKVDGPKLRREFLHEDGEIYVPEKDPVRGPQVMAAVQKLGQLLATKYQGYDANGHYNKVHEDLMLPFDEFLALNGCEAARDLWINPSRPSATGTSTTSRPLRAEVPRLRHHDVLCQGRSVDVGRRHPGDVRAPQRHPGAPGRTQR